MIQKMLTIEHQINLVAKRVTSLENRADTLSRGIQDRHRNLDQFIIEVPQELKDLITQVES